MSRYHAYLRTAGDILAVYTGNEPFSIFLRRYFTLHKKHGSTDRKQISHLCYCFFRLGKAIPDVPVEKRILAGLFLCSNTPNDLLGHLQPEWNENAGLSVQEKLLIINYSLFITGIFPWPGELSEGVDHELFCQSFLVQPDLFLRLRPGYEETVKQKLITAGIPFHAINPTCLALPNTAKADTIISLDKEAVVQDLNSQQTGAMLKSGFRHPVSGIRVWDCCAASGGKSIMLHDLLGHPLLTVSDNRESIMAILRKRFAAAGITDYRYFVHDLTRPLPERFNTHFDLVIADVPCTGSGTWSRTPEQLYFFDSKKIEQYTELQRKILAHVIPRLGSGGYLFYITCSVFKKENEEQAAFIREKYGLEPVEEATWRGYMKKADTMYAALFRKPLQADHFNGA